MSYKLYNRDGSGGFVVEAALALANVPYDLLLLESITRTPLPESFREVNPWGQVPVLITPEGDTLTESAAILIHLAACHPDKHLGPTPGSREHGQFLRWLVFMSSNLYETVLRVTYPERFTVEGEAVASIVKSAETRMGEALNLMEEHLRPDPFMFGDIMCVADLYLAMMWTWYQGERRLPRIDALTHSVASDPVVKPLWRRNFDHSVGRRFGRR